MLCITVRGPIVAARLEVGIEGRQLVWVLHVLHFSKTLSELLSGFLDPLI
jgi:hypothetical protein